MVPPHGHKPKAKSHAPSPSSAANPSRRAEAMAVSEGYQIQNGRGGRSVTRAVGLVAAQLLYQDEQVEFFASSPNIPWWYRMAKKFKLAQETWCHQPNALYSQEKVQEYVQRWHEEAQQQEMKPQPPRARLSAREANQEKISSSEELPPWSAGSGRALPPTRQEKQVLERLLL